MEFVNGFQQNHQDVSVRVYDAAGLFAEVLDNPIEYGFKDSISAGDSEDCIWFDYLHPTSAMHKILAADVAKFLTVEEEHLSYKEII